MNLAVELKPSFLMIVGPLLLHGTGFGAAVVFAGTVAFPGFVSFAVVFVVRGAFVEVDTLGVALSFSTSTFGVKVLYT